MTPEARTQAIDLTAEYFPPELLNRLDTMLVFNKLSCASVLQVVELRLQDVGARLSDRRSCWMSTSGRGTGWLSTGIRMLMARGRSVGSSARLCCVVPTRAKAPSGPDKISNLSAVVYTVSSICPTIRRLKHRWIHSATVRSTSQGFLPPAAYQE